MARGVFAAWRTLDRFPPFPKMGKKERGLGVSGGLPLAKYEAALSCAHSALSPTWPGLPALLGLDSILLSDSCASPARHISIVTGERPSPPRCARWCRTQGVLPSQ